MTRLFFHLIVSNLLVILLRMLDPFAYATLLGLEALQVLHMEAHYSSCLVGMNRVVDWVDAAHHDLVDNIQELAEAYEFQAPQPSS